MGKIRYEILNGVLPITVDLSPLSLQNIHTEYGIYEFDDITLGDYTLTFIDSSDPACVSEIDINPCITCPDGFYPVGNNCEQIVITEPTLHAPFYPLQSRARVEYGIKGTLIFDSFEVDGTGTFERINPTNFYWINSPMDTIEGPMNRSAVWTSQTKNLQSIGFSVFLDIQVPKTYYIGVGCDNYASISLNGEIILQQDANAIGSGMLGLDGFWVDRSLFNYWFIYPVDLVAGKNVLEIFGVNTSGLYSAVGVEVYDASKNTIMNTTSDLDLGDKLIFRAKDEVGSNVAYEYSPSDGYHGYTCPDGYSLVADTVPYCMKKSVILCGQLIADPPLVVETFAPDCDNMIFPRITSTSLTKQFIVDSFFTPPQDVIEFETIAITRVTNGSNSQAKYNGVDIYEGQIIDFETYPNIDIVMANYSEEEVITEVNFKIKLLQEPVATQEVQYKFINEGCISGGLLVNARVSLDTALNGEYNTAIETDINFIEGVQTTFSNPITASEYHYMFISIPAGMSFTILDPLDINITSFFNYHIDDIRAGYVNNKIYRYQEPFGTSLPVTFKITLTWND